MKSSRGGKTAAPLRKVKFPKAGRSREEIQGMLEEQHDRDVKWKQGRMWSSIYYASEDIYEVSTNAYKMFMITNPHAKKAFPSYFKFEEEVLANIADLFGGEGAVGSMTSGGSESNLLAMLAARDKARKEHPEIKNPEIVVPVTGHSSFRKAAHLFGLKYINVEVDDKYKAKVSAVKQAVNENTIAIIGSAAGSPHGVVDPIPDLASIAKERNIHFHTDACLGGFVLPFLKNLGYVVPDFDFRVPGVSSISVDPHKFGWSTKPCSCILYRDRETYRYQETEISDWAGGVHVTPNLQGTRAGGAVASIWAVMNYLGEEGYSRLAQKMMKITRDLAKGINQIPGLRVCVEPDINCLCFKAENIDIFAVAEELEELGWYAISRVQIPPGLRLFVNPHHEAVVKSFLDDLEKVTRKVERGDIKAKGEISY